MGRCREEWKGESWEETGGLRSVGKEFQGELGRGGEGKRRETEVRM